MLASKRAYEPQVLHKVSQPNLTPIRRAIRDQMDEFASFEPANRHDCCGFELREKGRSLVQDCATSFTSPTMSKNPPTRSAPPIRPAWPCEEVRGPGWTLGPGPG